MGLDRRSDRFETKQGSCLRGAPNQPLTTQRLARSTAPQQVLLGRDWLHSFAPRLMAHRAHFPLQGQRLIGRWRLTVSKVNIRGLTRDAVEGGSDDAGDPQVWPENLLAQTINKT